MNDSACTKCKHFYSEGTYCPETLDFPEIYCELCNDENFGTWYGCWDWKDGRGKQT